MVPTTGIPTPVSNHLQASNSIDRAANLLRQGGIVAFPTETVYGLGADAHNVLAVSRVYYVKRRPLSNPLILHIGDVEDLDRWALRIPREARKLAERFWPGPLTLVLPKRRAVADLITAGLPYVALRMPQHPVARELLRLVGRPIAAPSANRFGQLSPTTAEHVRQQMEDCVDMILDGGPCTFGLESTIVSFADQMPALLRPGAVTDTELVDCIGPIRPVEPNPDRPLAPGQMPRHYAPRTPLFFDVPHSALPASGLKAGLLAFKRPRTPHRWGHVEWLPVKGILSEAAAGLYAALHRLDQAGLDAIIAERAPERGLGTAINDRLRRAAWRAEDATPESARRTQP